MMIDRLIAEEPWDRVRLKSTVVTIGTFRITPSDPHFETAGKITAPVVVFPRTSVWIQHEAQPAFVADTSVVTYYNKGQPYTRRKLGAQGDHSDWFRLNPAILREMVALYDPRLVDRDEAPFPFAQGPSDARSYLLQRCVVRHLNDHQRPDLLFVEEAILSVLSRCLDGAFRYRTRNSGRDNERGRNRRREIAHTARAILAERFDQQLSLAELSRETDCSPFHLCRIFKSCFGTTIHKHRSDLRLRASLDLLDEAEHKLTQLALDLGYSSHSHFTAAFRVAFGRPPSEFHKLSRAEVLALARGRGPSI